MYAQVSQLSQRTPDRGSAPRSGPTMRVITVCGSEQELAVLGSALVECGLEVETVTFDDFTWPANKAFDVALVSPTEPWTVPQHAVQLIKSRLGIPVIALVPMTALVSVVEELQADDVAFLPLRVEELKARIKLLVDKTRQNALGYPFVERRRSPSTRATTEAPAVSPEPEPEPEQLKVVDREKKVIVRGTEVHLSPNLYKLLMLLASDPGRVFSIREISGHLWPKKATQSTDIQQCIHLLRRKIEEDPRNPSWVETVPGFGYKLNRPVQR